MTFDSSGTKLYCGYFNQIEIIDITRPEKQGIKQKTIGTRKSKDGQKGIISSISFNPSFNYYAAGSFGGSVGIYNPNETSHLNQAKVILNHESIKGVTKTQFYDDHYIVIGSRRSSNIVLFDLRYPKYCITEYYRKLYSDQRVYFDLFQQYLITGDQEGQVKLFDITKQNDDDKKSENEIFNSSIHNDTVSTTQFHPNLPYLLTTAGSRHNSYDDEKEYSNSRLSVYEYSFLNKSQL
ncbi:WD40 repeat-like protein [Neoconidiobolus thromboides FSU 785]|nr:WD40 repeat-like protein [Neoconidiobolus thromboides FSU 785]